MKKKILVLSFQHETNALCPLPADMTAFKNATYYIGENSFDVARGTGTGIGGVLKVLESYPNFELIPTVSMFASPSGPVTKDVFDFAATRITDAVKERGPVDGILCLFHGAMVAEEHPDAEGDMLEIIRNVVGFDIPIITSLDLHANVTEKMARLATAMIPFEEYPHVDLYATACAASQLLADTLEGKVKPVMAYRHIHHLLPMFPTARPEIRPLYDLTKDYQDMPDVLYARFTHGFFAADFEGLGMATLVITDDNRSLAESIAQDLADAIIKEKDKLVETYPTLDEALDLIAQPGEGPIVIADTSDNPGGGGLSNTTHILRRILERGITGGAFATIVDPECVSICEKAGIGATVQLELGGWSDPVYSGGPVSVTAYVRMLTDGRYPHKGKMSNGAIVKMGKTAVLEVSGNLIIVGSLRTQPFDLEVFRSHGIAPEEQKFLIVKSAIH